MSLLGILHSCLSELNEGRVIEAKKHLVEAIRVVDLRKAKKIRKIKRDIASATLLSPITEDAKKTLIEYLSDKGRELDKLESNPL